MQVSVETTQGLERRLTITVPAENVEIEVKKRLQQLSKTQRIDGFRAGRVPVSVINKRFGPAVRQEVAGEVMQRSYYEAVIAEKVNPAGAPTFAPKSLEAGKDLEFTATDFAFRYWSNRSSIFMNAILSTVRAKSNIR